METLLNYRGRAVTRDDVHQIRALVAAHPEQSRRALSETLCRAWDWRQANGATRSMVCRGLMLALWRAGHIELPAVRRRPPNPLCTRAQPAPVTVDTTALRTTLREVGPLTFVQVRRTPAESLFNSLMQTHHYLRYAQPVGEHLKFMVYAGSRPIALFAWSSAPRHLGPRDRFLGWSLQVRRQNLAGIDGLARICKAQLGVDPFCGWLVVFCNRRRTAIKILTYDGQGFWVCHKRLSQGKFPYWPTGGPIQELAAHQLQVLLMGADPLAARGVSAWRPLPRVA